MNKRTNERGNKQTNGPTDKQKLTQVKLWDLSGETGIQLISLEYIYQDIW